MDPPVAPSPSRERRRSRRRKEDSGEVDLAYEGSGESQQANQSYDILHFKDVVPDATALDYERVPRTLVAQSWAHPHKQPFFGCLRTRDFAPQWRFKPLENENDNFYNFVYSEFANCAADRAVAVWLDHYCNMSHLRVLVHDHLPKLHDMSFDDVVVFESEVVRSLEVEAIKSNSFYIRQLESLRMRGGAPLPKGITAASCSISGIDWYVEEGRVDEVGAWWSAGDIDLLQLHKAREMHRHILDYFANSYHEWRMLDEFCRLNRAMLVQATRVCAPKLERVRQTDQWLRSLPFWQRSELRRLGKTVVANFAILCCNGQRDIAETHLRNTAASCKHLTRVASTDRRSGIFGGMAIASVIWLLWKSLLLSSWSTANFDPDCLASFQVEVNAPANASIDVLTAAREARTKHLALHYYVPIYRSTMACILWYACWGILMYVWQSLGCNYHSLLGMDPFRSTPRDVVFRNAAGLITICSMSLLTTLETFNCDNRIPLHPSMVGATPLFMYVLFLVWLLWSSAFDTIPRLAIAIISPFSRAGPQNMDIYIGDVLTSLVKPINEIAYSMCFFLTGEFSLPLGQQGYCANIWYGKKSSWVSITLLLLPNALRIAQCFRLFHITGKRHPHVSNICKYLLGALVTLASLVHAELVNDREWFFVIWSFFFISNSVYGFLWDILMDWGLFPSEHKFLCIPTSAFSLREKRLLDYSLVYYVGAAMDLWMRFFGTWTLLPIPVVVEFLGADGALKMGIASEIVEVFRRTMWSVYKMEWMQVNYEMTALRAAPTRTHAPKVTDIWRQIAEIATYAVIIMVLVILVLI